MNENIFKALGIFLDAMRPFVVGVIKKQLSTENWEGEFFRRLTPDKQTTWNQAVNAGTSGMNLLDYNNLSTFGIKFKDELSGYMGNRNDANRFISCMQELQDIRNKCSHYQVIDKDETERAFSNLKMIAKMLQLDELYTEFSDLQKGQEAHAIPVPATNVESKQESPKKEWADFKASNHPLKSWFLIAKPHYDIRNGVLDESKFAANLSDVVTGNAPEEYTNSGLFFQKTYVTNGLRDLAIRVVKALNGEEAENRVISLQTGFGGGKTHSLISLYHIVRSGKKLITTEVSRNMLNGNTPNFDNAHVAVFTNNTTDVQQGRRTPDGLVINTLWGEIAYQLGGMDAYNKVKDNDQNCIAPTASIFKPIVADAVPVLILIDELADYCNKASARKVAASTLYNQTVSFVQTLTEVVSSVPRSALIATLPASATEVASSEIGQEILSSLETRIVRIGAPVKPVDDEEIFEVVRRRLFESFSSQEDIEEVISRYKNTYHNAHSCLPSHADRAEYVNKLRKSYPFQPELIDMFRLRWGNDSRFQRTRGVLRLLASIVQDLWNRRQSLVGTQALIHTSDVVLDNLPTLTGTINNLMGSQWETVMQADVYGTSSNAYKWDNQDPSSDRGRYHITQGLATTLLLASVGDNQHRGLSLSELKLCMLKPNAFRHIEIESALSYFEQDAHYLYSSNIGEKNCWFQAKANINILINQAKNEISEDEINAEILNRLNASCSYISRIKPLVNPTSDVPEQKTLALVILHPKFVVTTEGQIPSKTKEYIESIAFKRGNTDRIYRNTILFLAPAEKNLVALKDKIRDYLACVKIETDYAGSLEADQRKDVSIRKKEHEAKVTPNLVKAYSVIIKCSAKKEAESYSYINSNYASDFSGHVSKFLDYLKEECIIVSSVGRNVLARQNLLPTPNCPLKVTDLYEAFLRFDDKPMIESPDAIKNTVNKLCNDGVFNVVMGSPTEGYSRIYQRETIPFLNVESDEACYLVDTSVVSSSSSGIPSGVTPQPESGDGNGDGPILLPKGDSSASGDNPAVIEYQKLIVSGKIPMENWTQLFTSFINVLKNNNLCCEVKFTAKSTSISPLTETSTIVKVVKESASQLGLTFEVEE